MEKISYYKSLFRHYSKTLKKIGPWPVRLRINQHVCNQDRDSVHGVAFFDKNSFVIELHVLTFHRDHLLDLFVLFHEYYHCLDMYRKANIFRLSIAVNDEYNADMYALSRLENLFLDYDDFCYIQEISRDHVRHLLIQRLSAKLWYLKVPEDTIVFAGVDIREYDYTLEGCYIGTDFLETMLEPAENEHQ